MHRIVLSVCRCGSRASSPLIVSFTRYFLSHHRVGLLKFLLHSCAIFRIFLLGFFYPIVTLSPSSPFSLEFFSRVFAFLAINCDIIPLMAMNVHI
jgi:hypothetical protein